MKTNDQFIPYELALELKKLGFNEECFGWYGRKDKLFTLIKEQSFISNKKFIELGDKVNHICSAPLWQQAFDWFREEKDLLNHLTTHLNTWGEDGGLEESYGYRIMANKDGWKCDVLEKLSRYETYEEARQVCLEKLIELCTI